MMRGSLFAALVVSILSAASATVGLHAGQAGTATPAASSPVAATLDRYCANCHSERGRSGGLVLQGLNPDDVAAHGATLEKVVRKLRSGSMPPPGAPRPDAASYAALLSSIETSLDRFALSHPNPGRVPAVHRLNRAEYANAIRDLLDLPIDAPSLLPADDSGYGFDNIADVLSVSPMLTERYLSAATKISRLAIGNTSLRPSTDAFSVNKYLRQDDRVSEDLPFGSRGGLVVSHYFPVDADYLVKVFLDRTYDGRVRGLGDAHQLEVRLNGEKIQELTIGTPAALQVDAGRGPRVAVGDGAEVRFKAKAGPGVLAVTFLKKVAEPEGMLRPLYAVTSYEYAGDAGLPPGIASIELRGPYDITGSGTSPSRARIFVCRPAEGATAAAELQCARQILGTLARRAYRRPVGERDIEPLLGFYRAARTTGGFDGGIEAALRRLLVSPDFLFRIEHEPAGGSSSPTRLSDLELASRLSFFLWSSIPDDELLDVAAKGQLRQPGVLERQTKRMLADRRAKALVENFAGQWLYLRNVRLHAPDPVMFPDFDENLRQAFIREITLFLESQLREDHAIPDLLTADYTFLNERLATHYGVRGVYGTHFRRVKVTDESRRGLLGKGSVLMVTSYANRTSPVLRGKWLLENVLGAPPPPPPPDVPALQENMEGAPPKSVRERLEKHRANPVCASCHRVMDPLGFALENFDAIGRWRKAEAGVPIDASGVLADGVTKVDGPITLRTALLAHREDFVTTVAEKLLTYGLGRGTEHYDAPAIRSIVRASEPDNYRWSSIILGIVKSVPFQMRGQEPGGSTQ